MRERISTTLVKAGKALLWGLVFLLLYRVSLRNPSIAHDIIELFSIVVAAGIFMLTWNARKLIDNHYFLFLGIAYLFVGMVECLHLLAYGDLFGRGSILHNQLGYLARYLQGIALVIAPFFAVRKIRPGVVFAGFSIVLIALGAMIYGGVFPDGFASGRDTGFKFTSDFILLGLGVVSIAALRSVRGHFDDEVFRLLVLSILFAMASGAFVALKGRGFTYYLAGDFLEGMSVFLAYKAVIGKGMLKPYEILFRNLKRSEDELRAARDDLEVRVAERTGELESVNRQLERELAGRNRAERMRELVFDLLKLINSAKDLQTLKTGLIAFLRERSGCEAVGIRYREGRDYPYIEAGGFPEGFVHQEGSLCVLARGSETAGADAGEPILKCLCGAVISGNFGRSLPFFNEQGSFWTNDATRLLAESEDARRIASQSRCLQEGYESLVLIPLRVGGETLGLLQFNDRRKNFFTAEFISQYERVADHVAIALGRMIAEEEIQKSEKRFRSLVEFSRSAVLIVRDGRVVFGNPSKERLFGDVYVGERFRDIFLVSEVEAKKFGALCKAVEHGYEARQDVDLQLILPEGDGLPRRIRWIQFQTAPIDFQGQPSILVALVDVTRMKDLEQFAGTRQKLSVLGQLAAGIAHEIRNPVSGINLNVSNIEHMVRNLEGVSEEENKILAEIVGQTKAATNKITTVIRRVMDFSKPIPPKLDRVDVNRVVRDSLELCSVTLRKGGVQVGTSLVSDPLECIADSRLLEQVLLNLITNAVQAMESADGNRRLAVAAARDDGKVVITVSDSGPGVPTHLREKIFDPFYTTRRDGHGIGLSFSHRVIENLGGTLSVSSSQWGGAMFRITLPVVSEGDTA